MATRKAKASGKELGADGGGTEPGNDSNYESIII